MTTVHMQCPSGSRAFACGDGTRFVGCCASGSSPCSGDGCASEDLYPASFDSEIGYFDDQDCSGGSRFYTCKTTDPPFLGCCKSDPCKAGSCPDDDLTAAYLSRQSMKAWEFLSGANSSWLAGQSATSATSSFITSSTRTTADPAGDTTSPTSDAAETSSTYTSTAPHGNIGAIVGAVLGGVFLAGVFVSVWLIMRHRRDHGAAKNDSFATSQDSASPEMTGKMKDSAVPSYQNSPHIPPGSVSPYSPTDFAVKNDARSPVSPYYSPAPPQYDGQMDEIRPVPPQELPAVNKVELDGGQHYHPFRPAIMNRQERGKDGGSGLRE